MNARDMRLVPPVSAGSTRLPAWLTRPVAAVYGREIGRRNRRFDRGTGVTRLGVPVVSVGNLSVGGTGKTPVVQWVVRALQGMGHCPVIAMRGYKAGAGGLSDEQQEHAAALPGVPIVAQPDRIAGLRSLLGGEGGRHIDCVVLDDGFQHRRLARDLDIVLVDATRPPGRDALLPRGWLREPVGSLARAGAVVLTHAPTVTPEELEALRRSVGEFVRPGVPILDAEHAWASLRVIDRGHESTHPVAWLADRPVVAACAIGNPGAFLAGVRRAGARVRAEIVLPDHDPWRGAAVDRLVTALKETGAQGLMTTMKDWVKIAAHGVPDGLCVVIPDLRIRLSGDGESLRTLLTGVFSPDRGGCA